MHMIKVTNRMINKYIIDANKVVTKWAEEEMPLNYDHLNACEYVTYRAAIGHGYYLKDAIPSTLKLYRRPRGDKLLSIKHLAKFAKVGDFICFVYYRGIGNGVGDEETVKWIDKNLVVDIQDHTDGLSIKDWECMKGYIGISILPSDHVEMRIDDVFPAMKESAA